MAERTWSAEHERPPGGPAAAVAASWILGAFAAAVGATWGLGGALPIFTAIWLAVPLATLLHHRDPARIGIRRVPVRELALTTGVAAVLVLCLTTAVEPWSEAYAGLVHETLAVDPVDITFGWLVHFDGAGAWAAFVLFSGLVTIFAEELFFRGWLLQLLCRHTKPTRAIVVQAALFAMPQMLAAAFLSPTQGVVYVAVYAFTAIGLVGGWAAWRTASIWPSLIVATALNAILSYVVS